MSRLCIGGGRVIDPANQRDEVTDVYISDGHIAAIGEVPDGFRADREIDADNKWVIPGLIDLCAHPREPGQEHKATIASESAAAVACGITTLVVPPDTDPVIDTPAVVELIRQRAEAAGQAHILTVGALTQNLKGETLSEMAALKEAGCVALSNRGRPLANNRVLLRALEYAATFGMTVFLHSQDPDLSGDGLVHEGAVSTRLGLPGIPTAAETVALARDLELVARTGIRAHFSRLSCARSAQLVEQAQRDGLPVTADVAMHHLFLTENDLLGFDGDFHVNPPLRSQGDRDALRRAVKEGVVQAICSDHQPHEADAKLAPLGQTEAGISGLDTLLPLMLRLVEEGVLDPATAVARLSAGPAQVLARNSGNLGPGASADVTILDPATPWTVADDTLTSRGHNSPFIGWQLTGRVEQTVVGGEVVYPWKASA